MIISENLFESSTNSSLEILKQHFPNCFDKNGHFLPDKMAEQIQSQGINTSREYYTMNWLGKSYARYLRDCPPATLLAENVAHNSLPENQHSQNLLMKGDNLEVLKHLKHAYAGEVKMIYIDPPYNTGSDGFVYQDDRKFTPEQLAELANISLEEAKRVLDFTAKKSNSHSAWLTFMYPRLYIARELLKDDGVIFISIDDNEQAQLKLLCDEVFGEENFRNILAVKRGAKSVQAQFETIDKLGIAFEYILVYTKNADFRLPKFYFELDDEKIGSWNNHWRGTDRPTMRYELLGCDITEGQWRWSKVRSEAAIQNYNRLLVDLGENPLQSEIDDWYFDNGEPDLLRLSSNGKPEHFVPPSNTKFGHNLWTDLMVGKSIELNKLGLSKYFDNPKNPALIKRIVAWLNDQNDLILDFFAGSGTTAHAVMQLNAEDGGNRRFMMVQLPEETDKKSEAYKAGYKTIFDITKARIEKSAVKIRQDFPEFQGDLGFKIFETAENFLAVSDEEFHPIQPSLPETVDRVLSDEEYRTLLTTWRLYDGNALTESVQAVDLGGYVANRCGDNLYLLTPYFGSEQIKALLDKLDSDPTFLPKRIVLFGRNIDSAKQMELHQAVKTYANKKNIELNIVVRY